VYLRVPLGVYFVYFLLIIAFMLYYFHCSLLNFLFSYLLYLFLLHSYAFICSIHSFYLLYSCLNLFICPCIIYLKHLHTYLFNCILFIACNIISFLVIYIIVLDCLFGSYQTKTFSMNEKRGSLTYDFLTPR
jgi:hypothetical protein